ncbi:hypothetical protein UFOVP1244_134 [uncultured Caudovirales phage]|uniref:Uncharacterized protein n=1 Tax=uncultured Caudovirales phage TaxID=2100421 RepID=A0A6J5RAX2_9CAUD|nr:hypothetical protein UFOVP1244_134 [uncultured Caudovirales phage]
MTRRMPEDIIDDWLCRTGNRAKKSTVSFVISFINDHPILVRLVWLSAFLVSLSLPGVILGIVGDGSDLSTMVFAFVCIPWTLFNAIAFTDFLVAIRRCSGLETE